MTYISHQAPSLPFSSLPKLANFRKKTKKHYIRKLPNIIIIPFFRNIIFQPNFIYTQINFHAPTQDCTKSLQENTTKKKKEKKSEKNEEVIIT